MFLVMRPMNNSLKHIIIKLDYILFHFNIKFITFYRKFICIKISTFLLYQCD